jgi:transmembrane sensor
MSLETPIKRLLRPTTTTAESVAVMWSRIDARGVRPRRRAEARWPARRPMLLAAAAALFVLAIGVFLRRALPTAAPVAAGPVLDPSHAPFQGVHAPHSGGADGDSILLSDGSVLSLGDRGELEVLDNSGTAVVLKQRAGAVDYDVHPGGPRKWTIECGLATVEVVGTSFRIARSDLHLRVEVTRGKVLVRGERVPDRVVQLVAGMSLDVDAPAPPAWEEWTAAPPEATLAPTAAPPPAAAAPFLPSNLAPGVPSWHDLAARGEYEEAYATLGPEGMRRAARGASVEDLLALADIARLSRHARDAVAPLTQVISLHEDDSRASLAAFTLGRVHLDELHAPAAAADAFAKAIALGVPGGLAEDAYAHLVEARSRSGDAEGANAAYRDFAKRFPGSPRDATVRRFVSGEASE